VEFDALLSEECFSQQVHRNRPLPAAQGARA
jgi:hypothetical protein